MLFSTRAEYGIRVMVELARADGAKPISLGEVAEREQLPLSYLEHLVARLKKAGLVESRRGAHGGYLLTRSPNQITMAEVVEALEGSLVPIECISAFGATGQEEKEQRTRGCPGYMPAASDDPTCLRETDPRHACPTQFLWSSMRETVVNTLRTTNLSQLKESGSATLETRLDA